MSALVSVAVSDSESVLSVPLDTMPKSVRVWIPPDNPPGAEPTICRNLSATPSAS